MSKSMAEMLMDKRKRLESQARAILDDAEARGRDLTGEELRQFDELTANMETLKQQSDRLVKQHEGQREMAEALRDSGHTGRESLNGAAATITAQIRSLVNGSGGRYVDLSATQEDARMLSEHRALSKGTASAGGNAVPTTFMGTLYEHLIDTATLLRAGATIWTTDGGENMDFAVTTAHGTAALVAEGGTIPQADPVFAKRTLGAYKYGDLILVPTELLQDTGVDLLGYLARMGGRAVGNALGQHLITGTGSAQPTGLFTSTSLGVTSPTGTLGAPNFDTIIDLYYSVAAPYRQNGTWLIKDTTAGALRKLKDTSGRYLWESSVAAGVPDTILGHPVLTDPYVPATGLNAKSVAFGDLSSYHVRIVKGIRFERSDDFKFDADVVAFRCLIRGDGLLIDQSGSVKHLVGAAS